MAAPGSIVASMGHRAGRKAPAQSPLGARAPFHFVHYCIMGSIVGLGAAARTLKTSPLMRGECAPKALLLRA